LALAELGPGSSELIGGGTVEGDGFAGTEVHPKQANNTLTHPRKKARNLGIAEILRHSLKSCWHTAHLVERIKGMARAYLRGSLLLSCWLIGCQTTTTTTQKPSTVPQPYSANAQGLNSPAESYHPSSLRQASSALIYLAGSTLQRVVSFEVVDGMAVIDGDILLGPATFVPFRFGGLPNFQNSSPKSAVARSNRSDLWPSSEIPYDIDPSVPPNKVEWISWAAQHISSQTKLKVRPATGADKDRVTFRDSGASNGCHSYLGRVGGAQEIQVGGCGVRGSVAHELLHAAGLYHEQSRGDRDQFITISWDDIDPAHRSNFEIRGERGSDIGAYDYSSIMHYPRKAFSRTGRPTIIPKDPNAPIGQREGLSNLDRAALDSMYGSGSGTVPSVPPGTPPGTLPGTPPNPTTPPGGGGLPLPFPWPTTQVPWPVLTTPPPTQTAPPTTPPPPPTSGPAPWAGNYSSSRGPMACTENTSMVSCSFSENGVGGRLDCSKQPDGLNLTCSWMTFFPRPGTGRAVFSRPATNSRNWQGTWGTFQNTTNGGTWNVTGQ
jgi:hypothetical protein